MANVNIRPPSVFRRSHDGRGCTYVLNEGTLVLEGVTLGEVVKLVVEVLVDLAGSTVLHEKTAENPLATHPQNLPVVVEIPPSAKPFPRCVVVVAPKTFATPSFSDCSNHVPPPGPSVAFHDPFAK